MRKICKTANPEFKNSSALLSTSSTEIARPNQAPAVSCVLPVLSECNGFAQCFRQFLHSVIIRWTFIVYVYILCLKVRLKTKIRFSGCRFMRSKNAPPLLYMYCCENVSSEFCEFSGTHTARHMRPNCGKMRITNSMQQRPSWEANRSLATQETPGILWNQKVNCRIHKCSHLSLSLARSIQSMPTSGLPIGLFP